MKKVSNKYVNFGIAFALLGLLVFSLAMTPLEGFKETVDTKKKTTAKPTVGEEQSDEEKLKETLSQLQHLSHLIKKDDAKSV